MRFASRAWDRTHRQRECPVVLTAYWPFIPQAQGEIILRYADTYARGRVSGPPGDRKAPGKNGVDRLSSSKPIDWSPSADQAREPPAGRRFQSKRRHQPGFQAI